jgi:hypothetical protein
MPSSPEVSYGTETVDRTEPAPTQSSVAKHEPVADHYTKTSTPPQVTPFQIPSIWNPSLTQSNEFVPLDELMRSQLIAQYPENERLRSLPFNSPEFHEEVFQEQQRRNIFGPSSAMNPQLILEEIKAIDPHDGEPRVYRAYALPEVLRLLLPPTEAGEEFYVQYECSDKYQPDLSTEDAIFGGGYLAVQDVTPGAHYAEWRDKYNQVQTSRMWQALPDNHAAKLIRQGLPPTPGDIYAVWPAGSRYADNSHQWGFQLEGIRLISKSELFRGSFPEGGSERVLEGFDRFQQFCQSCHKIDESDAKGGGKGRALGSVFQNLPQVSIAAYLNAVIDQPPDASMPNRTKFQELGLQNRHIAGIAEYLEYISKRSE